MKKKNQHLKCIRNQIQYITVTLFFPNIIMIVKNLITFFKSKYSFLFKFFNDLNKFAKLKKHKNKKHKRKKTNVYDTASELYNELLGTYFDEYYYLLDSKRKKNGAQI